MTPNEQPNPADREIGARTGNSAAVPALDSLQSFGVILTVGGSQFLLALLLLGRSKVVAVLLGPGGVGIVSVVDQVVQLVVQLSALALSIAPLKFLSRTLHQGTEAVSRIYQALLKTLLLSLSAGTVLALLLVAFWPGLLGTQLAGYRNVILVGLLTVPSVALTPFFANVLASARGYRASLVYNLLFTAGLLLAAYIGIRAAGIQGLYYGYFIVGIAAILGVQAYVRSALRLEPHTPDFRLREEFARHPDLFAYCAVVYVLSFAQPLAFLIVRYVLIEYRSAVEAGYFQAAFAIAAAMSLLLTQSVRVYLEPLANRALPVEEKLRHANDFFRTLVVLILLGALPLVLFPREVLRVLFSAAFLEVARYLYLFVLAEAMFLGAQVYLTVILGIDDLRGFLAVNLAGHLSMAALAAVLIPRFGLTGVAASFLIARTVLFLFSVFRLASTQHLRLPPRLVGFVAYVTVALCVAAFAGRAMVSPNVSSAAQRIALLVVWAAGTYFFLNHDEKAWLRQAWTQIKAR